MLGGDRGFLLVSEDFCLRLGNVIDTAFRCVYESELFRSALEEGCLFWRRGSNSGTGSYECLLKMAMEPGCLCEVFG